jgi:2-haloacid dehalogenase
VTCCPAKLANVLTVIEPMCAFARECHKQGHVLHILSNIDEETADALCAKYPTFFKLFTHRFISAKMGVIKPNPLIYKTALQQIQKTDPTVTPERCCLVDDRPENTKKARELGWHAVLCAKNEKGVIDVPSIRAEFLSKLSAPAHPNRQQSA